MINRRVLLSHKQRLEEIRLLCEKHKEHRPVQGALYRSKLGRERHDGKGWNSGIVKGDIVMVVSEPVVVWIDEDGQPLEYPEWKNLSVAYEDKVWPITTMVEDRWYVWFERVKLSRSQ